MDVSGLLRSRQTSELHSTTTSQRTRPKMPERLNSSIDTYTERGPESGSSLPGLLKSIPFIPEALSMLIRPIECGDLMVSR